MADRMRLNCNGLIDLAQEVIEPIKGDDAWAVSVGLTMLNRYLTELAEHAIRVQDEWIYDWCEDMMLIDKVSELPKEEA